MERIGHKCGIFGVYGSTPDAARTTYFGLFALQHRGQEGSGIAASDGRMIRTYKDVGLVTQVYSEEILQLLNGVHLAVGHNRYGTSGGRGKDQLQPVSYHEGFVLAHNGNIASLRPLINFLDDKGVPVLQKNDSQLMYEAIYWHIAKGACMSDAFVEAQRLFGGAYALLMMDKDSILAARDGYGIRPISIGQYADGQIVISSETCAIRTVQARELREIEPGEMIRIRDNQMQSTDFVPGRKGKGRLDVFEYVYFARPDSSLMGREVGDVRFEFGRRLGRYLDFDADVVIPVPDSAIPAAEGVAAVTGFPARHLLAKNRYIGRSFISPGQHLRDSLVDMKYNALTQGLKGKRVIVVDDSIVRLSTAPRLVDKLRQAGAREVHFAVSSPPIVFPDYYGIDLANQGELIAAGHSIEEIRKRIGCDTLTYLPYEDMIAAIGVGEERLNTSCFTGDYPIDLGEHWEKVRYDVLNQPVRRLMAV